MRIAILALALSSLVSTAAAAPFEIHFYSVPLEGANVIPPSSFSSADGHACLTLDDATGQVLLFGGTGFAGNPSFTVALHGPADASSNGPVITIAALPGAPSQPAFSVSMDLSPAEVQLVRTGQTYIEVRQTSGPDDARRGQLEAIKTPSTALRPESVVPATSSGAFGVQDNTINLSASSLALQGFIGGLDGTVLGVDLHGPAAAGSNAPLITPIPFTTGAQVSFELSLALTPDQRAWARDGLLYVVVRTSVWPAGEARTQIAAGGFPPHEIGTGYVCASAPHSGGTSAGIQAKGSPLIADNQFLLSAGSMPANQFTFFVAGQGIDDKPFAGGSQGRLCISGPNQVRLLSTLQSSGMTGFVTAQVDLTSGSLAGVQPGDVWNFQAWFRDINPMPTSNFTTAVSVEFQ